MDLRAKKTKRSITNAFLQIRSKKPLERITVKELSALAEISKATFYLHYRDVYHLSEHLQDEVIENVLSKIQHPQDCLENTKQFAEALFTAFHAEQSLIEVLFSGSQFNALPAKIEAKILAFIKKQYPTLDKTREMQLTHSIYGAHYVYLKYHKSSTMKEIIDVVCG